MLPSFHFYSFFFVWLARSLFLNFYYAELLLWQWWFIDNFILIKMGISWATSRSLRIFSVSLSFLVVVSRFVFPMIRQFLECDWWKGVWWQWMNFVLFFFEYYIHLFGMAYSKRLSTVCICSWTSCGAY